MEIVNLIKLVPLKVENKEILFDILYQFVGGSYISCGTISYQSEEKYQINIPKSNQNTRSTIDLWFRDYLADNRILIDAALGNSNKSGDDIPWDYPPLSQTIKLKEITLIFKDGLLVQAVGPEIKISNPEEDVPVDPKMTEAPTTESSVPNPSIEEAPEITSDIDEHLETNESSSDFGENEMSFTGESFSIDDPMSDLESFMNAIPTSPNQIESIQDKQKELVSGIKEEEKSAPTTEEVKSEPEPENKPEPTPEPISASISSPEEDLNFSLPSFDISEEMSAKMPF